MSFKSKLEKIAKVLNTPTAQWVFLAVIAILFVVDVRSASVLGAFIDVALAYFSVESLKKHYSISIKGKVTTGG